MLRSLGKTGLQLEPLVLGGNVFGWTVDEKRSFELLDAYADAGFSAIDTADSYSTWVPGHRGGESETVIGNWLHANPGKRQKMLIFTKVGSDMGGGRKGLSARWIEQSVEDSLRRLRTEVIDLYQSHWPDAETPIEETLAAYEKLVSHGKVRAIGASNLDAPQLRHSLDVAHERGLTPYATLQPQYNLYDREGFEGELCDLCLKEGLGVVTYFSLASGFLSGKYRSKDDFSKSARGAGMSRYLNARGERILQALDDIAARQGSTPAEVALGWLIAQRGVTAPIASATDRVQLASLIRATRLRLTEEDMRLLNSASALAA